MENKKSFYEFESKDAKGNTIKMSDFKGKVVMIVNVASQCGFTDQYRGLEALYRKYKEQGLVILGFPCNQFGEQEPGNEEEILKFCKLTYDVTFPIMHKVDVNGTKVDPLYDWLKAQAPGLLGTEGIKWNFTKFLIGPNGQVLHRFAPKTKPDELHGEIETAIAMR